MSFSISQIEALSGLCAGMVSSFVSHPIDTVKIRMQLQAQGANLKLVPTVSGIYYHEGVRGFYKGVLSPIVGKAPLASVVFSSLTFSKRQLQPYNLTDTQRTLISGFFAGICYANTALIFDFFKIRAQNTKNSTMSYREEIKRVYLSNINFLQNSYTMNEFWFKGIMKIMILMFIKLRNLILNKEEICTNNLNPPSICNLSVNCILINYCFSNICQLKGVVESICG